MYYLTKKLKNDNIQFTFDVVLLNSSKTLSIVNLRVLCNYILYIIARSFSLF